MSEKNKGGSTPKVIPPISDTFENVVKAVVQPAPKDKGTTKNPKKGG